MNIPVNILDLTPAQFSEFVKSLGEPLSQPERILRAVYREGPSSFEELSDLSPALKLKLSENARLNTLEPVQERTSTDGQTIKTLFRLEDGKTVESSLIYSRNSNSGRERRTVCLSSQVGCPVGCYFCATGQQGFERNLKAGEIVEQALYFVRHNQSVKPGNGNRSRSWLTNVVFMGMGEPLANYDNVRLAVAAFNSLMGLGFHQVTLSTAGLVPQIHQLPGENLQFELAVSLHAANNKLRDRLVPINKTYPVELLMSTCHDYAAKTGRNVFIEYALFDGVNDSMEEAEELVRLLSDLRCSVNLILGNPTPSGDLQPSTREQTLNFQKRLIAAGKRTMIRVSKGADIEAGCGQLRSRWLNTEQKLVH